MSFKKDLDKMLQNAKKMGVIEHMANKEYVNQHGSFKRQEDIDKFNRASKFYEEEVELFRKFYNPPKGFWNKLKYLFK